VLPPPDLVRRGGETRTWWWRRTRDNRTFSDAPTEIAERYEFWLGAALRVRRIEGYAHKKMGIRPEEVGNRCAEFASWG